MPQKKLNSLSLFLATPDHPHNHPNMNTTTPCAHNHRNPSSNYANALKNIFRSHKKVPKTNKQRLHTMPKGWILLDKRGNVHENRTQEEIDEDEHYFHTQKQNHYMKMYINRFIDNTVFDMSRNGYTYEEIDAYLEELFKDEECDENSDDENNDSQDNDYDSGYDSF